MAPRKPSPKIKGRKTAGPTLRRCGRITRQTNFYKPGTLFVATRVHFENYLATRAVRSPAPSPPPAAPELALNSPHASNHTTRTTRAVRSRSISKSPLRGRNPVIRSRPIPHPSILKSQPKIKQEPIDDDLLSYDPYAVYGLLDEPYARAPRRSVSRGRRSRRSTSPSASPGSSRARRTQRKESRGVSSLSSATRRLDLD